MEINGAYCSPLLTLPIWTIEKGVEAIVAILAKTVLCRHDVKKINKIYRRIEQLERQSSQLSKLNSNDVLEKIVEKIEKIILEKNHFRMVTLYHLQSFSDKGLKLEKHFSQMWSQLEKNPQIVDEMAAYLSCCHSGQKRGKPQNYPPYLYKLLSNRHIHLYDHLMQMRAQKSRINRLPEVKKISFSGMAHIILETRAAILQEVRSAIPNDSSNVLFIIGGTGAGKSTTLCFLRGDEMVQENFLYRSKSDQKDLISEDIATSCTFLPTIEKMNEWMIVDFPGFKDTNGPLISLGIEFALKALIKEYQPKILVLKSITNIEDAKEVGESLKRLFKNKNDCLLGITKYSVDPDFREIKNIEAGQRKEQSKPSQEESEWIQALQKATQDELGLVGALEYALEDGLTEENVKEMELELVELRQKKEKIELELNNFRKDPTSPTKPLPETPKKTERMQRVKEKEALLSKQIGIKNIFRFDNLEDSDLVASCFHVFSKMEAIHPSSENQLDAMDERVLNDCFDDDLEKHIRSRMDYQLDSQNFNEFKKSVLQTSFISTIFATSHPEISALFHLPEMDPTIVHKYDKKIISDCIKNVIKFVVFMFDSDSIEEILKGIKDPIFNKTIEKFRKKFSALQKYILMLLNGEKPVGKADLNEKWTILKKKYQSDIDRIEQRTFMEEIQARANAWAILFKFHPLDSKFIKESVDVLFGNKKEQITLEYILEISSEVDRMHDFLVKLRGLERIITIDNVVQKIEDVFESIQIDSTSIKSMTRSIKDRINGVREIYGGVDWDKRVTQMKERFTKTSITENWLVLLFAYLLIEPNISYEIKINSFKDGTSLVKVNIDNNSILLNRLQFNDSDSFMEMMSARIDKNKFEIKDGRIEVTNITNCESGFWFSEFFVQFFNEPLLVNRALNAAAFLKANNKKIVDASK